MVFDSIKQKVFLKKDKNLIPRKDKSLEDAVELDGWGLVVFGNKLQDTIHAELYLREDHSNLYRLKFSGHVCYAQLPDFLKKEIDIKKIPTYLDCQMKQKERSCDKCIHSMHEMFLNPEYFK